MPISRRIRHLRLFAFLMIIALTLPLGGRLMAQKKKMTELDLANARPGRDPNQPIDEEYTRKIKKYTTETFFLSPLVSPSFASSHFCGGQYDLWFLSPLRCRQICRFAHFSLQLCRQKKILESPDRYVSK